MISIDTLKQHIRVTHNLEDELIQSYIDWATDEIIESVFDKYDSNIDMTKLQSDTTFQKGVILLATYYYENRLLISEVSQHDNPYSVLSTIQALRGNRERFMKVEGDVNENE